MKKLTLSLVAAAGLAASSLGAYAALPTGAAPFQVVVPNLQSGIEITLEGLYVQPTNSDLGYGNTVNSSTWASSASKTGATSSTVGSINAKSIDPDYGFGFRAGLGYIFPNSGNDVQLNWTHFNKSSNDAATSSWVGEPTLLNFTKDISSLYTAAFDNNANAEVSFKLDSLDLDVGQYVSIGTRLQTRFFVGLRGAILKNDFSLGNTSIENDFHNVEGENPTLEASQTNVAAANFTSKFEGVGPRLGVDTSYHISDCFGIVGHFATALLVGRVESNLDGAVGVKTDYYGGRAQQSPVPSSTLISINELSVASDRQTRVVPAFDAKLGLDYTFPFKNAVNGSSFSVEAGWQVTQYIDAIDRVRDFSSSLVAETTTSSVGFQGPYLSLNFKV
jgi:hypothetical protein